MSESMQNTTGLAFFPVDRGTIRSRIVRAAYNKFGSAGVHAFFALMELYLGGEGYRLRFTGEMVQAIAENTDLDDEGVCDLINCLVQCGFFDQSVYRETCDLVSRIWQEKWLFSLRSRLKHERICVDGRHWVLGEREGILIQWGERGEEKKKEEYRNEKKKEEYRNEKKKEEEENVKNTGLDDQKNILPKEKPKRDKDVLLDLQEEQAKEYLPCSGSVPLIPFQYDALCKQYGADQVRKEHQTMRVIVRRTGIHIASPCETLRQLLENARCKHLDRQPSTPAACRAPVLSL